MSKVKRSKAKTKAKAKAKRKSSRTRRKPQAPSPFETAKALGERYALAGIAGVGVILAGGAAILWAGGYFGVVAEQANRIASERAIAAGFGIERITLMGRHEAASDEIDKAIGPVLGRSILHFSPDAARARIEELGWVRAASVSRLLPNTIHVSISERDPAAVWQMSGRLHLIDMNGAVIREVGAYEYSNLPLIVGAGAPGAAADILKALSGAPEIAERTSALVRVGERRWNVRLKNGVDIRLPDENFTAALDAASTLQAANGVLDQPLEYIDLRDPERMTVRQRGAAADDSAG